MKRLRLALLVSLLVLAFTSIAPNRAWAWPVEGIEEPSGRVTMLAACNWLNAVDGSWSETAKWSCGSVPGPGDDVSINVAGTYTVTLDVYAGVRSLTLGGASGTQTLVNSSQTLSLTVASTVNANGVVNLSGGTLDGGGDLTVNGTFNWSGGEITGSGAFTVSSPLNISGAGTKTLDGRTITNNGTTNVTGTGRIYFQNGAVFDNQLGATFDIQVDVILDHYTGGATFNNAGTLTKSGGTGTTTMEPTFNNSGTVNVNSGTLSLTGSGTHGSTFNVGAGSTLQFAGGTHTLDGVTFAGDGTVQITGGTVNTTGSGATVNATTTLAQSGGTQGGDGPMTVNGTFDWSGGTISGSGAFTVNSPLNITGSGSKTLDTRTITNNGAANVTGTGTLYFYNSAVFDNQSGATFDIQTDVTLYHYSGSPSFNNAGTLTRSTSGGTATIGVNFNNTNTVNVNSGTLKLTRGGTHGSTFNVAAGSVLQFAGGTHTLDGVAFEGSGTVQITTGTVNTTGSGATVNGTITLAQSGGTLGGDGPMTVNGTYNWSGGTISGSGAFTVNSPLNFTGTGVKWLIQRTITNNGTANVTGTGRIYFQNGAVFDNQAGATFDIQVDVILDHYTGGATFNNAGTLKKSGGTGTTTIEVDLNNSGTVEVQSGVLNFTGQYVQTGSVTRLNGGDLSSTQTVDIQGGVLEGTGAITGTVSSAGQVSPGLTPGVLNIVGNYTQLVTGTLNIEVGGYVAGTDFDQLTVTGDATLTGTLDVSLIGGFEPQVGDSFLILNGTSTGTFSTTNLPALPPGREWDVVYGSVTLNVVQAQSTTTITSDDPDPSVVGQTVTVNFTVTSSGGTPTGDVTVDDGEGNSCTGTLTAGAGSCSLTPTSVGVKTLTASYPGDGNFGSSSDTEPHTVNKADTTTTITSDAPEPSVVGQAVTVNYTVAASAPGSGTPTGNVTVDDGEGNTCTGTVTAGSCTLTPTSAGAKTLTATYAGDGNFNGSSDTEPHQVNKADTTTTITSDTPEPSVVGQAVTVNYTVVASAPGSGTPTGNVTVDDGEGNTCTGTVAAGSCTLTPTSAGAKTLTATYAGDGNFNGSSDTEPHQVNKADTTTTITSDTPDPSVVGQPVEANYTVVASAPGSGTPTGNVTVDDGEGNTCTATVAAGKCTLTPTSAGAKTLTATYAGDSNFNGSSDTEPHQVNAVGTGTIVIEKVTDPADGTGFQFTNDVPGGPTPFNLDDAQSQTFNDVDAGSYTVTETDPTVTPGNYILTNLACVETGTANSTWDVGTRTVTTTLEAGETITCTFTNEVDTDGDGVPDSVEGTGDRDGDGIPDNEDYDPTGYFYDETTGQIIPGGQIAVTGPGVVTIVHDGSSGYYAFTTDGTTGTYTMQVTLPPGHAWSDTCLRQDPPPFDPTGGDNPTVLGKGENGATGFLVSNACTRYYLSFDLAAGDPFIFNNNFPLEYVPPVPVGGIVVPVNKLGLVAPWMGLAALAGLAALTVALVRRRRG